MGDDECTCARRAPKFTDMILTRSYFVHTPSYHTITHAYRQDSGAGSLCIIPLPQRVYVRGMGLIWSTGSTSIDPQEDAIDKMQKTSTAYVIVRPPPPPPSRLIIGGHSDSLMLSSSSFFGRYFEQCDTSMASWDAALIPVDFDVSALPRWRFYEPLKDCSLNLGTNHLNIEYDIGFCTLQY